MFYSTDILASRKSGFGLYWLAATVGSKGGTSIKKLTRKELLACNLKAACEQLASPEEPLALRLSSNLLCGIARVYQEQYIIYQSDVTQVHQSLKKAFNDVFKNPSTSSTIDLAPALVAATSAIGGGGAHGIDLPIDPALAVLGWDPDWNIGPDWGAIMRGEEGVTGEEEESDFGSGVGGTPDSPRIRATVSDRNVVKDLASITLQEPHLDDYRLQDYDDPARRYQEGFQDDGYGMVFGENDPGILEGHSREVDEMLGVIPRADSGKGVSSSVQGADYGHYGENLGGMDDFLGPGDYVKGGFELPEHLMGLEGDESHEDRVRREHAEAAVQRAGQGVGQRASSVDQPHPNLFEDGSPAGTLGSSKHKSWEDGAATVAQAKNLKTSPKKVKHIVTDSSVSLTDDQVVQARASYPERMRKEREKAAATKAEKEGAQRAMDLIFGPPEGFGGALADFWNDTVTSQLIRFGESRAAKNKKRDLANGDKHDMQSSKKRKALHGAVVDEGKVQVGRSGEWGRFGEEGADFHWQDEMGGGEQAHYGQGQDLGYMDLEIRFDDDLEAGRAGSGTQARGKESFPWNNEVVSSDQGAEFGPLSGASSQTGTARLSRDTPLKTGRKHRSRSAPLVPSALGSGRAGSQGIDAEGVGDLEGLDIEGEQLDLQTASRSNAEAIAYKLEQDSLKFFTFAQRIASAQPSEDLLFSDIVPVASTSNAAAAAAFYHLLALSTRGDIQVEQEEPYGEIAVQFAAEE